MMEYLGDEVEKGKGSFEMATMDRDRGQRLRLIRKNIGESQTEFGVRFGKTGPAISNYERGRLPEDEILKNLYEMGYSIDWLLSGEGQMRRDDRECKQPEELCTALFEGLGDGLLIVQDGVYKFVNKAFERITGYPAAELVGRPAGNHAAPDEKERIRRIHERYTFSGQLPEHDRFSFLCKDGSRKDVKACYASIQYGGKPAILTIVREDFNVRLTRANIGDIDSSLNQDEQKLVRVLKALLAEMVKSE